MSARVLSISLRNKLHVHEAALEAQNKDLRLTKSDRGDDARCAFAMTGAADAVAPGGLRTDLAKAQTGRA
jgi:hypothetical protein